MLQLSNSLLLPFIIRYLITHELPNEFVARQEGIIFRSCLLILIGLTIPKKNLTKQITLKAFERGYTINKILKTLVTVREYC